jgi:hypothetical protein
MKKLLLGILLIGFTITGNAQTGKGRVLVGGEVSFDLANNKTDVGGTVSTDGKTTSILFAPKFGYFFMDRLVAGAEITFQSETFKPDGGGGDDKFNALAFGPFVKYYLDNGVFGMGSFGIGSAKTEFPTGQGTTNTTKYGISAWRLGVGYAAFLNDNISVEPMLSYGGDRLKNKDANPERIDITNSLTISVSLNIFLDL